MSPEEIAKKLTKAQRADMLASKEGFFWTNDGRTQRGLERKGIVSNSFGGRSHWTPLGLAVRRILSESNHAG